MSCMSSLRFLLSAALLLGGPIAVADMVDRTSTELAPWTLVEAEDKRFARVKILRTIVDKLGAALGD